MTSSFISRTDVATYHLPHPHWPMVAHLSGIPGSNVTLKLRPDDDYPPTPFVTQPWPVHRHNDETLRPSRNDPNVLVIITLSQDTRQVLRITQFYSKGGAAVWNKNAWSDSEKARHRHLASALLFVLVKDFCGHHTTRVNLSASGEFPGAHARLEAIAATLSDPELRASITHAPPCLLHALPTLELDELRQAWVDHQRNYELVQFYERAFGFHIVSPEDMFDVEMAASLSTFLSNAKSRYVCVLQAHMYALPQEGKEMDATVST
jgi:hypothetical protein